MNLFRGNKCSKASHAKITAKIKPIKEEIKEDKSVKTNC